MPSRELLAALAAAHAAGDRDMKISQPLSEMRAELDARVARQVLDADMRYETVDAGGVPAVWVIPPQVTTDIVYLFFHGGAYVKANVAASHKGISGLCRALSARGLSVDYRVAPEHPWPAAVEDALRAYRYLLDEGMSAQDIAVAGSSAGGGLCLALLVALKDRGMPFPLAALPFSPWTDLTQSSASIKTRADKDPALTKPYLDRFAKDYAGKADAHLPTISPLFADFTGITTSILVQVGTEEILYDDAERLVQTARAAGLKAELASCEKGFHGWQNLPVPEARAAAQRAAAFILSLRPV